VERILVASACALEGLVGHAWALAPNAPFTAIKVMTSARRDIRRSISVAASASTYEAPTVQVRRLNMGRIVVSQNISLDGVVEDPTGEGGFRHGGWFEEYMGQDRQAWAEVEFAEAQRAEALLLGRRSDEYFGTRWSSRSGEWADRLNSLPKFIISSTLEEPKWTNATVLKGEVVGEVSRLKQRTPGEIVVYASRPLVRMLMEHDLVDELRLIVFPVALGAGERLFGETSDKRPLRLIDTKTIGNGLAHLRYERVR
jgi:dihydrofolate reductase